MCQKATVVQTIYIIVFVAFSSIAPLALKPCSNVSVSSSSKVRESQTRNRSCSLALGMFRKEHLFKWSKLTGHQYHYGQSGIHEWRFFKWMPATGKMIVRLNKMFEIPSSFHNGIWVCSSHGSLSSGISGFFITQTGSDGFRVAWSCRFDPIILSATPAP